MPNSIHYAGNTYAGDLLEDLLVYTAKGNDTFKEGLIHIKPGVQKRYVLPHVQLGSIIQENAPTPNSTHGAATEDGKNQYTFSERYLDPKDFMVYLEFNPRDFEEYWRPFQPTGQLIFRELAPEVQATMLHLLIDRKDEYLGDCIWCGREKGVDSKITTPEGATVLGGASAAGPMKFFDCALARILYNIDPEGNEADIANEKASGQAISAGSALLDSGEAVEDALYKMWKACPKNVRKSTALKFVMGWEAWDLYDEYLTKKENKYVQNETVNKRSFKGKPIVVINGMPEHTIVLGKFNEGMDSNLWMGVDYATDQESIKVERLQANSELYFFQMRMKVDVNIVLPSEIVVWTAYTKA